MRVLLVGEESAGIQVLRMLVNTRHTIVAVLSSEPTSTGLRGAMLADVARRGGHDVWAPQLVTQPSLALTLRGADVDLILNVHSLHIMHAAVAASARIGAFNLHPGPLPDYAGLNAPSWAILHGEPSHGVTVHWIDQGIDTGPIAYQSSFALDGADTGLSVSRRCVLDGMPLIATLLSTAASDATAIPRIAQDPSRRRYFGRQIPRDGVLDWTWPACKVDAMVRAFDYYPLPSPWGVPRTYAAREPINISRVRRTGIPTNEPAGMVGDARDDGIPVACTDEWVTVTHLERDGRRVRAEDHLRQGMRLTTAPT